MKDHIVEAGPFTFYFFDSGRMILTYDGSDEQFTIRGLSESTQDQMERALVQGRKFRADLVYQKAITYDPYNPDYDYKDLDAKLKAVGHGALSGPIMEPKRQPLEREGPDDHDDEWALNPYSLAM
jgi:hypothetical protein